MIIRPAAVGDASALAGIDNSAFRDGWSADFYRDECGNPVARLRVADEAGEIMGFLLVWSTPPEAELLRMAVAREYRNRGIAERMLADVLNLVSREGVWKVFLEVRRSNAIARHLYNGRGFLETGVRPGYYRNPVEDAVCMEWTGINAGKNPDRS